MIDIEKERREFAAMMRARPGRSDIGGNDDAFIAQEFFREFDGWLAAKRATDKDAALKIKHVLNTVLWTANATPQNKRLLAEAIQEALQSQPSNTGEENG